VGIIYRAEYRGNFLRVNAKLRAIEYFLMLRQHWRRNTELHDAIKP
jgi:hypothetical protein